MLDRGRSTSTTHNTTITVIATARGGRVCGSGSSGYCCHNSSSGSCCGASAHARARAHGSSGMRKIGIRIANRDCQVVASFGETTGE